MPASDLELRLRALRQQFLDGLPARALELESWLRREPHDRDPADVIRVAHRLRGVAPSHGLTVLGGLAASIEDGCKRWDAARVEQAARDLMRALHESAPQQEARGPDGALATPVVAALRDPSRGSESPKRLKGFRVIAIDDDPMMRRLLALTLETVGGADAVVVGSAAEMVAELERTPADLVISDLMMPEESGPQLLRRLIDRDLVKRAIVVLLSATSEIEQQGREGPVPRDWTWLTKPFRPPQLVETLASLLDARGDG